MRNGKALHCVDNNLSSHVPKHTLLFVERLLVGANKSTTLGHSEVAEDLSWVRRQVQFKVLAHVVGSEVLGRRGQ